MKEREGIPFSEIALTAGLIGLVSLFAFSRKSRQIIYDRDVTCRICGGVNHLEAAHIDHDKKNPMYDDPSNGLLLCVGDHLEDHINRAGRNGLPIHQNNWAIHAMIGKIKGIVNGDID